MKVILQRDIARLGQRGEVKDVADGYAINVLIKKGDAIQATPAELQRLKQKEESKKHKKELETNAFARLIETVRKEKIEITGKKADQKGQLFAQIKEPDVVEAIFKKTSLSVNPKQIHIPSPIKSIGQHTIELQQGPEKEAVVIEVK